MRRTKNVRQALYNLAGVFLLRILMSPHCQTQPEEEGARDPLRGPARRRPAAGEEEGRRCGGTIPCGSGRRQVRAWVAFPCLAGGWNGLILAMAASE